MSASDEFHPRVARVLAECVKVANDAVMPEATNAIFWLVFWSFVIALTPLVLGLAWKLGSGIALLIGVGLSRAFEPAEKWRSTRLWNPGSPSSSSSMAGMTQRRATGRSWARISRGPS
jgi:hypothetical protein